MSENIVTANQKYSEAIGKDYGYANNEVQAGLLNGFAHGLFVGCGGERHAGMQIHMIADGLTPSARSFIQELAASIAAIKDIS